MKSGAKIGLLIGGIAVVGLGAYVILKKRKEQKITNAGETSNEPVEKPLTFKEKTCPNGFIAIGDGSACQDLKGNKCALRGNSHLGRCYCPKGYENYGDGSACIDTMYRRLKCAKWGNPSLERCSDI